MIAFQKRDPLEVIADLWPSVKLYDKQEEIIKSVYANDETYVVSANMMGKDFIAAYLILVYFLQNKICRIVTTSVSGDHVDVLWSEINKAIHTCRSPMDYRQGGPLIINNRKIRKRCVETGVICDTSIIRGIVAENENSMSGRHAPATLFVGDEAAGLHDFYYNMAIRWSRKFLFFGNPLPCQNFYRKAVDSGDEEGDEEGSLFRKVIKIRAEDSPNVRLGLAQERTGWPIEHRELIPGVLSYREYKKRRKHWNKQQQSEGLDAEFYEGDNLLLFPPEWLSLSEELAETKPKPGRIARRAMGVDSAMGGDNTSWCIVSDWGVEKMLSVKTPDSSVIVGQTLMLMDEFNIRADDVLFDMGGGGKQHAEVLRNKGHDVRVISFGAAASPEPKLGRTTIGDRRLNDEERKAYKNRRAEMYGVTSVAMNPQQGGGLAIPNTDEMAELRQQLAKIPRMYNQEGLMFLPPKRRKDSNSREITMTEIVGHSPDEADAFVLAVFGLKKNTFKPIAGVL